MWTEPGRWARPTGLPPLLVALWLGALTLAAAPASYVQLIRAKAAGKPNIILIVADGLGYGDLGCYGQQRIQTRNLDRLAGEGMRFTQWYAGSPHSIPSRASLLTGLHTGHSPIRDARERPLSRSALTLATFLQNAGYKTCALGVWGLGRRGSSGVPGAQGFDEWLGALDARLAHDYYPASLSRNDDLRGLSANVGGARGEYAPDLYTKAALNFVAANRKFPFFLYLATPLPGANRSLATLTGNGMQVPEPHDYSNRDWPLPERNKAAMITHLDDLVGQIMAGLERFGLTRDSLIIFTSSAGPLKEGGVDPAFFASAGPLRGLGSQLYEGGLRVPFLVRWPGRVPAGKVTESPGAHWDLFATAANLALTNPPASTDGLSILPTLLGQTQTRGEALFYWESHEDGFAQALREADWKAVRPAQNGPIELYNLETDPGERHNVAAEHPEVVGRMETLLHEARSNAPPWNLDPVGPSR